MNRTIKDATVKRYFYEAHGQLRVHLATSSPPTTSAADSRPSGASPHTNHLQSMDFRASDVQTQSAPANAGTRHLGGLRRGLARGGERRVERGGGAVGCDFAAKSIASMPAGVGHGGRTPGRVEQSAL